MNHSHSPSEVNHVQADTQIHRLCCVSDCVFSFHLPLSDIKTGGSWFIKHHIMLINALRGD